MASHVEWETADAPVRLALPGEQMPDGNRADRPALMIGRDGTSYMVIEGSPVELIRFAETVTVAAMSAVEARYTLTEDPE